MHLSWFLQDSSMWFVEFMQQALYHPVEGYYSKLSSPFGKAGDFVTAPLLTPLFGQTLAKVCAATLTLLDNPIIFEFGAGNGQLCVDILTALEKKGILPNAYLILELSHSLKTQQEALLKEKLPHLLPRVSWLKTWPKNAFQGVVIANEVLDAMPVHRFKLTHDGVLESKIMRSNTFNLQETWHPCISKRIEEHIKACTTHLKPPYISECNGLLDDWLANSSKMLAKGLMLLIDYGFPLYEYYHEDRDNGTIMCHYRQHAHSDFLHNVGGQDITAHVDFTHVAKASLKAGFNVAWFSSQAAFLLENGILDMLSSITGAKERFAANQQVMQLLSPTEMGELFKVMVLTKQFNLPFAWQKRYDKRGHL
ncbi:MAG: hypothetical protein A3F18_04575 [Legionellales bacterium RIFCSPHIGHO2_12_FULL_37_14]|nr:MAG: hypothetical protein A3F18_04575 [Legionellales bacterium RIFCSPHIGHO2_12_FULL_37_14]